MSRKYYLKHPIQFLQQIYYNIKNIIERAKKGYSYFDVMDMDDFLLTIIPPMLREIGKSMAYPGNSDFPTPESWENWCNNLAAHFEEIQDIDEWIDQRNEYAKKWHTINRPLFPDDVSTTTYDRDYIEDIQIKYFKRELELTEEHTKMVEELFAELAHNLSCLWI